MFEYLFEKCKPLLDIIVDPVIAYIKKLPKSVVMLLLFMTVSIGSLSYLYYDKIIYIFENSVYIPRVLFSKDRFIPFSSEIIRSINSTKERLSASVSLDLENIGSGNLTPWSAAQAVVSLLDKSSIDTRGVVEYVNSRKAPGCECWADTPDRLADFHNPFITGWIFFAFSELGYPLSDGSLDLILSEQHEDGWWPTFPANKNRQWASTYATSWALIGLYKQKQKGYINAKKETAVARALRRGASWLVAVRDHARWKNYPYLTDSKHSESISGLVLHTINMLIGEKAHRYKHRMA
jgi:hypothetical protein